MGRRREWKVASPIGDSRGRAGREASGLSVQALLFSTLSTEQVSANRSLSVCSSSLMQVIVYHVLDSFLGTF